MQGISIIRPNQIASILALYEGENDSIVILATVSVELVRSIDGYDWVGFYRVVGPGLLKVSRYQGGHSFPDITLERGVSGVAAQQWAIQLIDDVDLFKGHIAWSGSTKSELVIPCFNQGG